MKWRPKVSNRARGQGRGANFFQEGAGGSRDRIRDRDFSSASGVERYILPQKIQADSIFGSATRDMIRLYQAFIQVPVTGEMNDVTWSALMHTQEPTMFERALQLTAHFEGTGFTRVVGNFDGAGLTWGIIGFTLSNGELGAILADISTNYPTLFNQAFGSDASVILDKMKLPSAQRVAWGDTIRVCLESSCYEKGREISRPYK